MHRRVFLKFLSLAPFVGFLAWFHKPTQYGRPITATDVLGFRVPEQDGWVWYT
jgi:hypothetical protein